jgi:hypothetical protein
VIRRATPYATALAIAAAFGVPSLAAASSGGSAPSSSGAAGAGSGGGQTLAPTAQPANLTVTAAGDGMTISTTASAILRQGLTVTGSVSSASAGQTVEIELWGAKTHWIWQPVATAPVAANGTFAAVWPTNHIGRFSIRAVTGSGTGASTSASVPTVSVTVFRPSVATLYGPGFYGHKTACGVVLRRNTIGVANRTLPCGTPVAIYYQGQTVIVPVIDRGPYAYGADWDLTMATGRVLGMTETETIGAVSLPASH